MEAFVIHECQANGSFYGFSLWRVLVFAPNFDVAALPDKRPEFVRVIMKVPILIEYLIVLKELMHFEKPKWER